MWWYNTLPMTHVCDCFVKYLLISENEVWHSLFDQFSRNKYTKSTFCFAFLRVIWWDKSLILPKNLTNIAKIFLFSAQHFMNYFVPNIKSLVDLSVDVFSVANSEILHTYDLKSTWKEFERWPNTTKIVRISDLIT